jgi:putative methionine-R-sulfoxide reductase with GAF domain/AAA+ ATPase superfamily predicted ATPase
MKLPNSIHSRLRLTYIGLATIPLLIAGLILTWITYSTPRTQVLDLQQELALRVATQVEDFIDSLKTDLEVTVKVSNLVSHPRPDQEDIFSQLHTAENAFVELALLDLTGKEVARFSYLDIVTEKDYRNRSDTGEFLAFNTEPKATVYYGPVFFSDNTHEPHMLIAIPLEDLQTGTLKFILVADVSLKNISDLIASVGVVEGENVYIVDQSGQVIAHPDQSVVLRGTHFNPPLEKGTSIGLVGLPALIGVDQRRFGEQTFIIVAEASITADPAYNSWIAILSLVVITIGTATFLALVATNRITRPIQTLVTVADEIRKGDLSQRAGNSGLQELDTLASTFNSMTDELRQTLEGLEQRVAARTQALKTSAEVSHSLTTILDTDKLVTEVANLVQSAFDYYHVNIYLFDESASHLVLAAGTGEAGKSMLANQYRVPKDKGLIGQAATTNHPILAPDVVQNLDWMTNPWLPDTKAELVIPIARGDQVLGVLDIQHHTGDGLNQEDVDLMQSIANQLAVAFLNAQSFEKLVAEKLAEAKQKEDAEKRLEAYQRSPVGQAELFAQKLLARPENSLIELHELVQTAGKNSDAAAVLSHLPRLMDETRPNAEKQELHDVGLLAKMAEGYHYLFSSQNAPELLLLGLRTLTKQLDRPSTAGWQDSAKTLEVYRLCQSAVEANTILQITELDWNSVSENIVAHHFPLTSLIITLAEFQSAIEAMTAYERVGTLQDKLAYLVAAVERLRHIERTARTNLGTADVGIVLRISENWQGIVARTLSELQTQARINCRLVTRHTLQNDVITLILNVRNEGRGAAINLKIKVLPGLEYTLIDETAELNQLVPAAEEQVVLYIRPHPEENKPQFRVRFVVLYDDPRGPNQTEHFADVVHLVRERAEFQYIPNPYIVGTPLEAGSNLFFGREDLLAVIQEILAAAHQNNLVLIGQRRMGKTSLLKQLRLRLDDSYIPIYLDGQVMGLDPGMTQFFLNLATEITFALEDRGFEFPQPNLEDFETSPAATFEHYFLPNVFRAIEQRNLLILFDEFEELERAVQRGHLDASIFGYLRHLMQHISNLSFIFCGTHRLEELAADYWNVLFNISLYKRIGYLAFEEAMHLVRQPVESFGMGYDDLALDKMWRVTAGHPYFLQLLCHSLVNRHNKTERNYITVADVNAALDEILSAGEAHFIYLWTESTSEERVVLVAISRMLPLTGSIQAVQVNDYLVERGIRVERRDIREALHRLMLRDILKIDEMESGGESIYRWQLGLLGLWVEKYKSLGRVMDEVTV